MWLFRPPNSHKCSHQGNLIGHHCFRSMFSKDWSAHHPSIRLWKKIRLKIFDSIYNSLLNKNNPKKVRRVILWPERRFFCHLRRVYTRRFSFLRRAFLFSNRKIPNQNVPHGCAFSPWLSKTTLVWPRWL